jgi:hypothetical protein
MLAFTSSPAKEVVSNGFETGVKVEPRTDQSTESLDPRASLLSTNVAAWAVPVNRNAPTVANNNFFIGASFLLLIEIKA